MKHVCITIGGTDPSGGAGVSLDLQVFKALSKRGLFVISVVVAQNSEKVFSNMPLSEKIFTDQLTAVFSSNKPDSIKIGLIASEHVLPLNDFLKENNISCPIVFDPVFSSSSGFNFSEDMFLRKKFPHCSLITPNIIEAEKLSDIKISTYEDMLNAGKKIRKIIPHSSVLIKGGHFKEKSPDYLFINDEVVELKTNYINKPQKIRGTGCLLSSAISSYLAEGNSTIDAIKKAKQFIEQELKNTFQDSKLESVGYFKL
jgi:hydroxymethylpyrimidine/phosphomethylpyrimidine kinase